MVADMAAKKKEKEVGMDSDMVADMEVAKVADIKRKKKESS